MSIVIFHQPIPVKTTLSWLVWLKFHSSTYFIQVAKWQTKKLLWKLFIHCINFFVFFSLIHKYIWFDFSPCGALAPIGPAIESIVSFSASMLEKRLETQEDTSAQLSLEAQLGIYDMCLIEPWCLTRQVSYWASRLNIKPQGSILSPKAQLWASSLNRSFVSQ